MWLRLKVMASALAGMASGTFDPLLDRATTERSLDDRLLDLLERSSEHPLAPPPTVLPLRWCRSSRSRGRGAGRTPSGVVGLRYLSYGP